MRTHDAHVIKPQKKKQAVEKNPPAAKSRKLTPRAWDNPQEQETTPSDVTDAGREPGEAKKDTRKTKDCGSTPRGEHNQFTHFSYDPTNVQDNRHSESERWRNGTPPIRPNTESESRHGHRNALVVFGLLLWLDTRL